MRYHKTAPDHVPRARTLSLPSFVSIKASNASALSEAMPHAHPPRMPATALSQQPPAHTVPISGKRERIPPQTANAVRLLVSGECKTQKAAATRVGMNISYLSEQLAKPKIQAFVARETRRALANGTMRAGARLVELLDGKSEAVAAQVAQRLLVEQGILQADQGHGVNVAVNVAGYIINLSEPETKLVPIINVAKAE